MDQQTHAKCAPLLARPCRAKLEKLHNSSRWGRRREDGTKWPLRVIKVVGEEGNPIVGVEAECKVSGAVVPWLGLAWVAACKREKGGAGSACPGFNAPCCLSGLALCRTRWSSLQRTWTAQRWTPSSRRWRQRAAPPTPAPAARRRSAGAPATSAKGRGHRTVHFVGILPVSHEL